MTPIIISLLDTDLYKFTMWQAILHRHPQNEAEYTFTCRNQTAYPLAELVDELNEQFDHLCSPRYTPAEQACLRGLRFMRNDFVDYLRISSFQREFIHACSDGEHLRIEVTGPQVHAMGFEIYVRSIVDERYLIGMDAFLEYFDLYSKQFDTTALESMDRQPQVTADMDIERSSSNADLLIRGKSTALQSHERHAMH